MGEEEDGRGGADDGGCEGCEFGGRKLLEHEILRGDAMAIGGAVRADADAEAQGIFASRIDDGLEAAMAAARSAARPSEGADGEIEVIGTDDDHFRMILAGERCECQSAGIHEGQWLCKEERARIIGRASRGHCMVSRGASECASELCGQGINDAKPYIVACVEIFRSGVAESNTEEVEGHTNAGAHAP